MTATNHEALWDAVGTPAPQASALTAIALCLHELVSIIASDHQVNLRIVETLESIEERLEEIGDVIGAVDRNLSVLGAETAGVSQAVVGVREAVDTPYRRLWVRPAMNHAIATLYKGIEYRSRLEARWAAFFTEIGWRYVYEPFDGNGYIPDFLIYGGAAPLLVEVKPAVTPDDYHAPIAKIEAGLRGVWSKDVLILGAHPWTPLTGDENYSAGYRCTWVPNPDDDLHYLMANLTCWSVCEECRATSIGAARHEPCGHLYGLDDNRARDGIWSRIEDAWAGACNEVKWHGRSAS